MDDKIWIIDANVLVNWVLGSGGLLKQLCNNFEISDDFFNIFYNRYKQSDALIETIINSDLTTFPMTNFSSLFLP
jgi:hypothetical protein